ncbi:MAG: aspartate kinase [Planctomycetota bacterium]
MPLVVQKFGGTSVADSQKILAAARKAVRAHQRGNQVVMVVSAMGKNTDTLIELAAEVNENPPAREMDMLLSTGEQVSVALMAMAIASLGYKAVSLTGAQIGIRTDSSHTKARIHSISTDRVKHLLNEGNIVIAAGFQGIDENYNITTLGRGGSDTTAVALAAVLGADQCEIYTDVDGVYTTDPRVLPEACLLRRVCYDEMLELASLGAGVLHSRSVEFGKKFNVPIHVRSSLSDVPGSLIVDDAETSQMVVSGAALTKDEAIISILRVPNIPGTIYQVFAPIAEKKLTVDMIVQNVSENGTATISFTVPRNELSAALSIVTPIIERLGGELGPVDDRVSKVSVVGLGMAKSKGVANRMFRQLADSNINMDVITTSEIKISALVAREEALNALRTVHSEFQLDTIDAQPGTEEVKAHETVNPSKVVERLQGVGMEGLTIDEIDLDEQQSLITLGKVPNEPGIAAALFDQLADAGVFVDMIVQSYGSTDVADITFTVPQSDFEVAVTEAEKVKNKFGCERVEHKKRIAKLSVSGIGLRSHTGVAIGMFEALAKAGINMDSINTSEVRVNVVVDGDLGEAGLACLKEQFAESLK